jgi:hypothetical protein
MYSKCQKCGRKLTDPESIERGYGPECWGSILPHYSIEQEEPEESIPGQMTIEDFLGGLKMEEKRICPECGMMEALDTVRDFYAPGMTDQQWKQYKEEYMLKYIKEN